jgi:hypothetical protein
MGMSEIYGTRDDQESIATIHRAVGLEMIDNNLVENAIRPTAIGKRRTGSFSDQKKWVSAAR